jgi:Type IV pilin-like G and H, putative
MNILNPVGIIQAQVPNIPGISGFQPVSNQLIGQWQVKDIFPAPASVIFAPEGKLFILLPGFLSNFGDNTFGSPTAYEFRYQIDTTTKPMQFDLISSGDNQESLKTIFEVARDGKLRVEFIGLRPGESRPTEFTTGSILIEKVSNFTTLPRNTKIINAFAPQKKGQESEGKQYIASIIRAQQAYFLENNQFSPTIEKLGLGIQPETEKYSYRTLPQGNQRGSVVMTAAAKKPGLRSYAGVAYLVKMKAEEFTIATICETDEPSSTPPAKLTLPKKQSEKFQCPAGSHLLR